VSKASALGAFRSRDFRIIAIGNMVSQLGTWIQYVAIGWAATKLTNSALLVAVVFAAQWFPYLVLSPFTGVIADRFNRRKLVLLGNLAMILPSLGLGILSQLRALTIPNMTALVIAGGVAQCFTQPAANAFVPELVATEHVHSAISLNSGLSNSTRIIGPAIGGVVMATWGVQWGFYLNAFSFLAVAGACLAMHTKSSRPHSGTRGSPIHELMEGFRYLRGNKAALRLIVLTFCVSFFVMHPSLMPLLVKQILHGDAKTYGWVSAGPGIGFVVSMIVNTLLTNPKHRSIAILVAGVLTALAVLVIGVSHTVMLTVAATALFGGAHMTLMTLSNTILVTATDDAYRGRVMGVFAMTGIGVWSINSLVAGVLGKFIGVPQTIVGCGAVILLIAVGFALSNTHDVLT
jgi:MFS family permease